ncbi:MAG: hypothetical protein IIT44_06095 [Erysipelotrichaceae bacterium]|nr:hypothetical protein [Erysipelotrichaceae bacterium]MBQ2138371.1 hypothetical protein [Erysipelotrichaceae bacterium]MBQ2506022.1 hypothetical protein [Erysipelotrichaceae bacterium]MBQ2583640.1 hypothetical protein [Erysipelotrichaceae bacterium]MBQ4020475.1 hypothetical protein [Erysipelotrichaceae bacterium]
MKKRFAIFIVLLSFFLCLSACTKKEEKKEENAAYDLGGKTYYNTVDNYGHEDHSRIWFGKDGTFVMTDSYSEGTYEIAGKWTLDENVCSMDVESSGKGSFSKIIFEVMNEDSLKLRTSLEGSKAEDMFTTTEIKGSDVKPKEETTPSPSESGKDSSTGSGKDSSGSGDSAKSDTTPKPEPKGDIPCTSITSLYHNYWSYVGEKNWDLEIRPVPSDTTDKITFSSSDENVVKIDDQGRATAVGVGNAVITAKCGKITYTVNYEVRDKNAPKNTISGTFQSKNENSAPGYEPKVVFEKSGNFTFTENFYAGLGDYIGTYKIEDDRIYCTVTKVTNLASDSVKEIVFKINDENTLKLKTNLTMSYNSELFYRQ